MRYYVVINVFLKKMELRVWKLVINLVWRGLVNMICYFINIVLLGVREKYENYEVLF